MEVSLTIFVPLNSSGIWEDAIFRGNFSEFDTFSNSGLFIVSASLSLLLPKSSVFIPFYLWKHRIRQIYCTCKPKNNTFLELPVHGALHKFEHKRALYFVNKITDNQNEFVLSSCCKVWLFSIISAQFILLNPQNNKLTYGNWNFEKESKRIFLFFLKVTLNEE